MSKGKTMTIQEQLSQAMKDAANVLGDQIGKDMMELMGSDPSMWPRSAMLAAVVCRVSALAILATAIANKVGITDEDLLKAAKEFS